MQIHIDPDVRRAILEEVVDARAERTVFRDAELTSPNSVAALMRHQAEGCNATIRALRRVLAEIRWRTFDREATYLRAGSIAELRGESELELRYAWGDR